MKNSLGRFVITFFLLALPLRAETNLEKVLNSFSEEKDYLGLRVFTRHAMDRKLSPQAWTQTRAFIIDHLSEVGYDLLYAWDKHAPVSAETKRVRAVQSYFQYADDLLLKKDYAVAFSNYQKVALSLKQDIDSKNAALSKSAAVLYPYVLDGMGRSLYGLKRYKESAEVFGWIPFSYPRYRRVLFEQMWASFQSGRVDQTLGRIAAQFSTFFSDFHLPEAYLMQAYVYKKLCRQEELTAVIQRMKRLRAEVKDGTFTWKDWLKSDVEGFILTKILEANPAHPLRYVTQQERDSEKLRIKDALERAFENEKPRWLDNMETAIAYAQLSTGHTTALRPVAKLPSREQLYKMKLEIWPAESREEWLDELGSNRYVGESKCVSSR